MYEGFESRRESTLTHFFNFKSKIGASLELQATQALSILKKGEFAGQNFVVLGLLM